jgi:monovalent cation:proton antiporter-2 (CPA2) family protein
VEHVGIPWLRESAIFLVAAGIVVPVFHSLRLSPVLGFLLVGVAIGPFGIVQLVGPESPLRYAVISDLEGARALSELGIVFLMFTIGVELSLGRLWSMRRLVLGLGSAQIIVTAAAISVVLAFMGTPTVAAMVLGGALALSSTAIVMQLLAERRQLGTSVGRASFGVLLMQDLAAVPILVLVGLAGASDGASAWAALGMAMLKAAVAVAAIVVVGRLLLGPALRWVSATRSRDLFMAITLLAILATAWITAGAGLSMALGAFLAGLLVSESEFRHQIEADIEPFKGLLLGLFFLSVGMGLDPQRLWAAPGLILGAVVALGLLKAVVIAALALAFGLSARSAIECGLLLGQAGEFSFVVIALAAGFGGIAPELAQTAGLVVGLSMLMTPPIAALAHMIARKLPQSHADGAEHAELGELEGHVIVAGYGRVGRRIAQLLQQEQVPFVALDLDAPKVARARTEGVAIFVGDAGRAEILARLNAASAQALVVTTDDPDAAERAVIGIRLDYPDLPVFARARDEAHAARLREHGATAVVEETVESSLQLAGRVLGATGVPGDTIDDILAQHRDGLTSR